MSVTQTPRLIPAPLLRDIAPSRYRMQSDDAVADAPDMPDISGERRMLEGEQVAARNEALPVLALWGFEPGEVKASGALPGMAGTMLRPLVEIRGSRYVVRRQPPDLTEADLRFRHAFMGHLTADGLPVPELLRRPDGTTFAIADDGLYEVQSWRDGVPFVTEDSAEDRSIEAAARTLGRLHQASAGFEWLPHRWPEERSAGGLANSYIALIRQAAERAELPAVTNGLTRIAEACQARADAALAALDVEPAPPQLHIHGDYQAHNLRFGLGGVSALYDFDAARWETRLIEVAYSLLFFTGVRWDEASGPTPPLVDDGLDILRVHRYLGAYGREAPPAEGEAQLLADALALVLPIVFVNGIGEDIIFPDDFAGEIDEEDVLMRLEWADSFWLWLDRYRDTLAQAWESGS